MASAPRPGTAEGLRATRELISDLLGAAATTRGLDQSATRGLISIGADQSATRGLISIGALIVAMVVRWASTSAVTSPTERRSPTGFAAAAGRDESRPPTSVRGVGGALAALAIIYVLSALLDHSWTRHLLMLEIPFVITIGRIWSQDIRRRR